MDEYFRGVIWPRKIGNAYNYAVVGAIVTPHKIAEFNGNEFVLSGYCFGLKDSLSMIRKGHYPYVVGDATEVLVSLGDIIEGEPQ